MKRQVTGVLATMMVLGAVVGAGSAMAQDSDKFPRQPILFVVAGQPGGGADIQARNIVAAIERAQIIDEPAAVLNKGGGGSQEPFTFVADREGNPHYLLAATAQYLTYTLTGQAAYKLDQFTPIASLISDPSVVVVPKDSPIETYEDLIAAAKADPGKLNHGGGITGAQDHMSILVQEEVTGAKFNFVSFGGGADLHAAILGGHIDVASGNPSDFLSSLASGDLRCLAILNAERSTAPVIDKCPTAKEQGYDVEWDIFRGWVAPAGIEASDIQGLEDILRAVTEDETFKKDYIEKNGQTLNFLGHEAFSERLAADRERYIQLLTNAGILK